MVQCDEEQAHALGRTMAVLHDHAEGFVLPAGADLTVFDEPLFHDHYLLEGAVPMPDGNAEVVTRVARELPPYGSGRCTPGRARSCSTPTCTAAT